MTVNLNAQKKILAYVAAVEADREYGTAPLLFNEFTTAYPKEFLQQASLDDLVHGVLYTTHFARSINSVRTSVETWPSRNRSSLDIWRHCKYFRPDITIFEVMDSLYRQQGKLKSQFCWQVMRRVFNSVEALKSTHVWVSSIICHASNPDEYKMRFSTWSRLVNHSQEVENV